LVKVLSLSASEAEPGIDSEKVKALLQLAYRHPSSASFGLTDFSQVDRLGDFSQVDRLGSRHKSVLWAGKRAGLTKFHLRESV